MEVLLDVVHVEIGAVDLDRPGRIVCEVLLAADGALGLGKVGVQTE